VSWLAFWVEKWKRPVSQTWTGHPYNNILFDGGAVVKRETLRCDSKFKSGQFKAEKWTLSS
jgi:hypothetical protein